MTVRDINTEWEKLVLTVDCDGHERRYVDAGYARLLFDESNRLRAQLNEAALVLKTISEMPMTEQDNPLSASMRTLARAFHR